MDIMNEQFLSTEVLLRWDEAGQVVYFNERCVEETSFSGVGGSRVQTQGNGSWIDEVCDFVLQGTG
jgi:hypothetical protein